jgi:hypothetical protein
MKLASMFAAAFAVFVLNAPLAAAQDAVSDPTAISQIGQASQAADSERVIVTAERKTRHLFQRLEADCLHGVDPVAQFEKNEGCAVVYYGNEKNVRDLPVWVLGFEPGAFPMADIPVVFVCALDRFDRHVVTLGEAANGEAIQKTCRIDGQRAFDRYAYQEAVGLNILRTSDYSGKALADFQDFLRYKKHLAAWWEKQNKKTASRDSYSTLFCGSVDYGGHCPREFFGRTQTPYSRTPWE